MTGVSEFEQVSSGHPLRRLLEIPKRRPWHIVVPCVVLASVAFATTFFVQKRYKSHALVSFESEKIPETIAKRTGDSNNPRQRGPSLYQRVLSRNRVETLLNELNPYPEAMGHAPLSSIVERFRYATEISPQGTEAFTITFVHTDPKMAMDVTNRLAALFIEESAKSRVDRVEGASDFLEDQLADARAHLDEKEREVRRYKEMHTGRLPEQTGSNLAALQRFEMERQGIETSLSSLRDRELMLERGLTDPALTTGPGAVARDPSRELLKAQEDLAVLRARYTDEHPDVRAQRARIAKLERDAAEAEARATSTVPGPSAPSTANRLQIDQVRGEIRRLQARRSDIESQVGAYNARVEAAPRTEQELRTLTRDFDRLNENYQQLLTRKLNAQMTERAEKKWREETFKILDPAFQPERPYFPSRALFTLVGAVLGLVIGVGLAAGVELFDPSVKNQDDLAEMIPHPVLVTFPTIPKAAAEGPSGRGRDLFGGRGADVMELDEWRAGGKTSRG